jgi:hypothetical protein
LLRQAGEAEGAGEAGEAGEGEDSSLSEQYWGRRLRQKSFLLAPRTIFAYGKNDFCLWEK